MLNGCNPIDEKETFLYDPGALKKNLPLLSDVVPWVLPVNVTLTLGIAWPVNEFIIFPLTVVFDKTGLFLLAVSLNFKLSTRCADALKERISKQKNKYFAIELPFLELRGRRVLCHQLVTPMRM